ncbi:MAG: FMN-binding protein [Clostridia bacterium]|nr:FMN-binding protein [Clostridia bacterium]
MKNNDYIRLGGILLAITSVVALLLGFFNDATRDIIAASKEEAKIASMQSVMPQAAAFTLLEGKAAGSAAEVQAASDAQGTSLGWCFTMTPKGYGGTITLMVGVNTDLTVSGVEIVDHGETAGLGANAQNPQWLSQFTGKSGTLSVVKNAPQDDHIQAVTSATITSKAVTGAVNEALALAADLAEEAAQ